MQDDFKLNFFKYTAWKQILGTLLPELDKQMHEAEFSLGIQKCVCPSFFIYLLPFMS
jgi:hypothetical protein